MDAPQLTAGRRNAAARARARGAAVSPFPGVLIPAGVTDDVGWLVAATQARLPRAVFLGDAAAALTYWPERAVGSIDVAARTRLVHRRLRIARREIPDRLIREVRLPEPEYWVRVTVPALTAVDLAVVTEGNSIDQVLRSGRATPEELWSALRAQPGRTGNRDARRLLLEAADGAWSGAERRMHRALRLAGVTGWRANATVRCGGARYVADLLFREARLVVEVDGFEVHGTREAFESDRARQNALEVAGYHVLRFTWRMLRDEVDRVVATIEAALRERR